MGPTRSGSPAERSLLSGQAEPTAGGNGASCLATTSSAAHDSSHSAGRLECAETPSFGVTLLP
eukprot:2559864-Prymnesium_polylepis.1